MKYLLWLLPALLLSLASCQYKEGLFEKKVDNHFAIKVTDYMTPSTKLHPNPDLQYENQWRTVYLLVLDTLKTDIDTNLEGFATQAITTLAGGDITKAIIRRVDSTTAINGLPALQYEVRIEMTDEVTWFDFVAIEAPDRYYQVIGWTILKRKKKFGKDINNMVTSFRLLP
jgi:hypothetical protein